MNDLPSITGGKEVDLALKHMTAFSTSAPLRKKEIRGGSMETETVQERGEMGVLAGGDGSHCLGCRKGCGRAQPPAGHVGPWTLR